MKDRPENPAILVVGHGRWGAQYAQRLAKLNALAGLVVQSDSSAQVCRSQYQRPAFTSLDEALSALKPDGIAILSPSACHVHHALEAIKAKIPVMVIKPVAARLDATALLESALNTHQTPYFAVHEMVWMPAIERMKKAIDAGRIGAVEQVRSFRQGSFHGDGPAPPPEQERPGENLAFLYDSTMHEVAVLNHLANKAPLEVEVEEVYASVARPEILAKIDYGEEVVGHLEYRGDPSLPDVFSFSAKGELGTIHFEATSEETTCVLELGDTTESLPLQVERPSHPIDAVIDHFMKITEGLDPAETLHHGIHAMKGAELLSRAAAKTSNQVFEPNQVLGPEDQNQS